MPESEANLPLGSPDHVAISGWGNQKNLGFAPQPHFRIE